MTHLDGRQDVSYFFWIKFEPSVFALSSCLIV